MKRVYNPGSYLKLSVCMLSLAMFSEDLSARSPSFYGQSAFEYSKDFSSSAFSHLKKAVSSEQLSKVKDSLRGLPKKGTSIRELSRRAKAFYRKSHPTWTTLQGLQSDREESEGILNSIKGHKIKKNHVKRLGRMASLEKIEGMYNPYRLSIAERLAQSDSRKAQAEGRKILWKIAKKPTHHGQQAVIQLLLDSEDDKLVEKGHKAQQTILKQPNDSRFVDVSIYYFRWGSQFPQAQEQASENLKQLLMNPQTSPENFQKIVAEVKHYHHDFKKFIQAQFTGQNPYSAEVLKDNKKNSIIRDFLEKETVKNGLYQNGNTVVRAAASAFSNLYPSLVEPSAPYMDDLKYAEEVSSL